MFTIEQINIIEQTTEFVKDFMKSYDESHNFEHVIRVKTLATKIAITENLTSNEIFEVQLSALTHDINDHKYTKDLLSQELILKDFFKNKLHANIIANIITIACNVSLSKQITLDHNNIHIQCKKLDCVRDADRIDSLGSIGITRYFIYGIKKNNSNVKEIIKNIEMRTNILIKNISTTYGKQIANKKFKIIQDFIEDFNNSI